MLARSDRTSAEKGANVLDAYIIDEIKKRDDQRRRREDAERPRLEIEPPARRRREEPAEDAPADDDRGAEDEPVTIRLFLAPARLS